MTDDTTSTSSPNFFDRAEYEDRLQTLRGRMQELRLDAIIVSAPENIFYLSGYQTKAVFTFQLLILDRSGAGHLVTRYMEKRNADLAMRRGVLDEYTLYHDDDDPIEVATAVARRIIGTRGNAGIELGSWTMTALRCQDIMRGCSSVTWTDVTSVIDRIRLVKSAAELRALRQAAMISDRVADLACAALAPGVSEDDAARLIMDGLITERSEYPASWPNVMVGRRTGLIHAAWSGERIQPDDIVLLEVTGVRERYHAPCLRTVMIGKPEAKIRRAAAALAEAHAAAISAIEPGLPARVINDAATASLSAHDLGCDVAHRAGYSVGIGFPPSWGAQWQLSLNSTTDLPLELGMTFHIVLVAHFDTGHAIGLGRTVALLSGGPECWTDGGERTWTP